MSCLCSCFTQKKASDDLKTSLLDNQEDETNSINEADQTHRRSTSSSASFTPSPFKVSSKLLESPASPADASFLRSVKSESPDSVASPYKTERMERDEPVLNPMSMYSTPSAAYQQLEQLRSDPASTNEALFDAILALIDEYVQQDQLESAQPLLSEAITLCPLDDHESIPASTKLAYSCHQLKIYDQATAILHRNIPLLLQSLGPLHDLATANLNLLMQIYADTCTDSLLMAQTYLDVCLKQLQEARGESHEFTLNFINFAADINEKMGQWQHASGLYTTLYHQLQKNNESTGNDSAQTLGAMNNLAVTLFQQGQSDQAEELLRDCWQRKVTHFGSADHAEALTTAQNLVGILLSKGKQEEADEFMAMILAQVKEQEVEETKMTV